MNRTHFVLGLTALALLIAGPAAAQRASLSSLQADIDALADDLCGPGTDPAACTSELAPSVRERLGDLDARTSELEAFVCQLALAAGTPAPGLPCSLDGELRLVDGPSASAGRLEINFSEVWGTVCDDRWTNVNAEVACRQLGFDTGVSVFFLSNEPGYSIGAGQIWLDDVTCTGTETRLEQCTNRGVGVHNCSHFEDVGVSCSNNP